MDFLRDARDRGVILHGSAEAEDLHVESLAHGAGVNLSCYVDAWKWRASEELRTQLENRFGADAAFCGDLDGDGWPVLSGDCDDFDGLVFPGAAEAANGIDDDCDGVADESQIQEPEDADFIDPFPINSPASVEGQAPNDDRDAFIVSGQAGETVEIELCSRLRFDGSVEVETSPGLVIGRLFAFDDGPACDRGRFVFPDSSRLLVTAQLDPAAAGFLSRFDPHGLYSISFNNVPRWPSPAWGKIKKIRQVGGALRLKVRTKSLSSLAENPTHVRLWVSGIGPVATVPWVKKVKVDWAIGRRALARARLSVRAQLLADGEPVSGLLRARFFESESTE
jgi:hypothetical protein